MIEGQVKSIVNAISAELVSQATAAAINCECDKLCCLPACLTVGSKAKRLITGDKVENEKKEKEEMCVGKLGSGSASGGAC